jgi:tripartite-type tricarboxylate transporter receptor subunit TctC
MSLLGFRSLVALALAFALPAASHAQGAATFPGRAVRIVIPLPPGGVTDGMARFIAQKMQETWGQPVVPENRPGASHFIAAEHVAKSAPDGHTILFANHATLAMNAGLFAKLPYDPIKDFTAISLVVSSQNILMAHPSVPAKDLRELIALAKAQPGRLNYGSQGLGSSGHVGIAMIAHQTGTSLVHVPYKGPALATQDLIGGQVQLLFDTVFSQLANIRAGKLKALAISTLERHPLLPEVPTVSEQGLQGYEVIPWFGLVAPAATPRDIVAKLNAEVVRILQDETQRKRLTDLGLTVVASSPEAFQKHINDEHAKWSKLIRELNIRAD